MELTRAILQVVTRSTEFQPQNISNTVWAFASLGHQPSEQFLEVVEEHLMEHLEADTLKYSCQARPCRALDICIIDKDKPCKPSKLECPLSTMQLEHKDRLMLVSCSLADISNVRANTNVKKLLK